MKLRKQIIYIPAVLVLLFSFLSYPSETSKNNNNNSSNNQINIPVNKPEDLLKTMTVHYIDVGKADSIFIELPNDEVMLIDAGESYNGPTIEEYIRNLGYNKIDYLIVTHPDADHIGGMGHIINNFEIKSIYMPKVVHTTKTYENLLTTIKDNGLTVKPARAGTEIINEDNLKIDILAPISESYKNTNDYSVVIKIIYGNKKFLFMGDAQTLSEKEILTSTADVSVDVLKVGHHGSESSSHQAFLDAVGAEYAVITVGYKKNYNLPSPKIVERLKSSGMNVLRTDEDGTIIITTNGVNISIKTENKVQ